MPTDALTIKYLSEAVAGLIGVASTLAIVLLYVVRHPVLPAEPPRTKRGRDGRFVR